MDFDGTTDLVPILGFPFLVLSSRACEPRARLIATRSAAAYAFLAPLLSFEPDVTLWVLTESDWPVSHPPYGMPYFDGRSLVVAGEPAAFWAAFVPLLLTVDPVLVARAREVYGAGLDLSPFFELLAVHELGHAFHGRRRGPFPRHWLDELFANLCLHAFVATVEPAMLPVLTTFPLAVTAVDAARFELQSLEAFEDRYSNMDPVNYGWYQCQLHLAAGRVYEAGCTVALQRLGRRFVPSDAELALALKADVDPVLAQVLTEWPPAGPPCREADPGTASS